LFSRLRKTLSATDIAKELKEEGIGYLYINWSEVGRLNDSPTYGKPYALTDKEGEKFAEILENSIRLYGDNAPMFSVYQKPPRTMIDSGNGVPPVWTGEGASPWMARLPKDYPALFSYRRRGKTAVGAQELYRLR
jgi:hypothetical protein